MKKKKLAEKKNTPKKRVKKKNRPWPAEAM